MYVRLNTSTLQLGSKFYQFIFILNSIDITLSYEIEIIQDNNKYNAQLHQQQRETVIKS